MKLAIILPSLRNVGPVRVAYDIVCGLTDSSDIEVTVFYMQDIVELKFPCEVRKLGLFNVFDLYSFDVIHSHMIKPDFINGFLPFFKGKKISTLHNIVESDLFYSHGAFLSKVISRFWLLLWKRMDKNVVLSNVAKNYYSNFGLNSDKTKVIYNGVQEKNSNAPLDKDVLQRIGLLKEKYTILGTICLFNHRKGLEQVINALPYLKDYAFVIIGDGPVKDELQQLAHKLGVESRLVFLGFLHNASSYLNTFDIYMMPSREEGFALSLLDAIVAGVPTVCSDIPVFKESFEPDEVSFFHLDDVDSLIDSVNTLKTNGCEFAKSAKLKFLDNYTQERMVKNYNNLFEELCLRK